MLGFCSVPFWEGWAQDSARGPVCTVTTTHTPGISCWAQATPPTGTLLWRPMLSVPMHSLSLPQPGLVLPWLETRPQLPTSPRAQGRPWGDLLSRLLWAGAPHLCPPAHWLSSLRMEPGAAKPSLSSLWWKTARVAQ